jgi:hypothetical protein
MSDPGFTRPDLYSIHAAGERAEFARAARDLLSADGCRLADEDLPDLLPRPGARAYAFTFGQLLPGRTRVCHGFDVPAPGATLSASRT